MDCLRRNHCAEGCSMFNCCLARNEKSISLAALTSFLIFLSSSPISGVTLFTQLAPFALFCDLDVTPDFSSPLFMTDVNARDGKIRTRSGQRRPPDYHGLWPKALTIFDGSDECFDHLSIDVVAVKLIHLGEPEVIAAVVGILRVIGIAPQITKVLHQHKRPVEFRT